VRLLILGASGSLGRHVTQQAVSANHKVSALVRTPAKLPAELREKVVVHHGDLASTSASSLAAILQDHEAVINTAGMVTDGQVFVDLVDRIVTALETLPDKGRPVCWFLAGAALLELDGRGRRAVDSRRVASTYWPHLANFDRIRRTSLDWRLLCPGPMVDQRPVGLARMRLSLDRVPVGVSSLARFLPGPLLLPFFAYRVPEMIVSYADAAALMLANLTPSGEMSRHRVGLALPVGMRGKKKDWAAKPKNAPELS
jgi:uncharacterized protein